jgi:HEPN domain-containing protein
MADAKIVKEWLQKADEDLDFAASIVDESPFYAQICFHFQQAAEKYHKAVIIADGLEFKKSTTWLRCSKAARKTDRTLLA